MTHRARKLSPDRENLGNGSGFKWAVVRWEYDWIARFRWPLMANSSTRERICGGPRRGRRRGSNLDWGAGPSDVSDGTGRGASSSSPSFSTILNAIDRQGHVLFRAGFESESCFSRALSIVHFEKDGPREASRSIERPLCIRQPSIGAAKTGPGPIRTESAPRLRSTIQTR